jgi:asparagine N-glycosylation enzyme membrane subunit Stt3
VLTIYSGVMVDAAEWLRGHSPDVGPRRGNAPTPWTVLCMWDLGNYIAWLGQRPVVATSFQNQDYAGALYDFARVFYGDGDPTPLLDKRQVRYLVLPAQDAQPEYFHRTLLLNEGPPKELTLYRQLFDLDGAAARSRDGRVLPALAHFRLVHESALRSPGRGQDGPALKIFERVASARLIGTCEDGFVTAESAQATDRQRPFVFRNLAPCLERRFELMVPYAGEVVVQANGVRSSVSVTVDDVVAGREVTVR